MLALAATIADLKIGAKIAAASEQASTDVQQAAADTSEVSSNIAGVTKAASDTGQVAIQVREGAARAAA